MATKRCLSGTSERHFEMEVTWPTGGKHILEEIKNHHSEALAKTHEKIEEIEKKLVEQSTKVEANMQFIEGQMEEMKDMMEKLLTKSG